MSRLFKLIVALVLLAIAAGWGLRLIGEAKLVSARERFEAQVGSLALEDYVLPSLEDAENAAVWLRRGAEQLEISAEGAAAVASILDEDQGTWSEKTVADAEALLEVNREATESMRRSIGLQDSSFDFQYELGFNAVTPPMLDLYRAGLLIALDLRLALATGEHGRVARDLEILDQLSRSLARESFLLSALMHLGVERLYLGAIRDVIEAGIDDRALLQELESGLAGRGSGEALRRGMSGEAAAVLTQVGLRGTETDSTGRWERFVLWLVEPFQLASLLETYSETAAAIENPWIETLQRSASESGFVSGGIHSFMLPNLLDSVDKVKSIELSQNLARGALGLHQQSLEYAELSQQLDEVVVDPYAAGSVIYEVLPTGGANLSAPEAIALWMQEHSGTGDRREPVFIWGLAAPEFAGSVDP